METLMTNTRTLSLGFVLMAGAIGCGDSDDMGQIPAGDTGLPDDTQTDAQGDAFAFTFDNESGAESVPDFSGDLLVVGDPELLIFQLTMTHGDGRSLGLSFEKEEGPLLPGTYSTTLFSHVFTEGATCNPSNLAGQSVDVTFASVEPVDATVVGTLTCRTGTPDAFTVDVTGSITE